MNITTLSAIALLTVALASTASAQARWQLVEDLRIGSDGADATTFTDVRSIVAGPTGSIFVLDARPQEIRMFDRTGRFVSLVARRGQGPGEIAGANGMILLRDTIWANDPRNGRWPAWSAVDGRYARQLSIPIRSYGFLWEAGTDGQGRIVDPVSIQTDRTDEKGRPVSDRRLRRVRTDGGADTIPLPECTHGAGPVRFTFIGENPRPAAGELLNTVIQIPFFPRPLTTIDGRGGMWCARNDEYVLVHFGLGKSDTLRTIRLPYTRLPIPRATRDSAIEQVKKSLSRFRVVDADYSRVPAAHPVFARLDVDDRGQLWARHTAAAGSPATFDVFDAGGRRVATVTSSVAFNAFRPLHIRGEHVYGVVFDEDDVPTVVRARIVR